MKTGRGRQRISLADRFWIKVDKSGDCWQWIGSIHPDGYGRISRGRPDRRMVLAHRASWEINRGEIPHGIFLDHICHNRSCVKPDHLRLVSTKQNSEHLLTRKSLSGVRGVTWDAENKKFRAQVMHNYRRYNIGRFETIEEAAEAARLKRVELFTHNDADRR